MMDEKKNIEDLDEANVPVRTEEEAEETVMKFQDEEGNVIELQIVARIYLDETEYLVLSDASNDEDEFVFRVDEDEEGNVEYNAIEDDEEFLKVKKEYSRLLYEGE